MKYEPNYHKIFERVLILNILNIIFYWCLSLVFPRQFLIAINNDRVIQVFEAIERLGVFAVPIFTLSSAFVMVSTLLIAIDKTNLSKKEWFRVLCCIFAVTYLKYKLVNFSMAFDIAFAIFAPIVFAESGKWTKGIAVLKYLLLSGACILYQYTIFEVRNINLQLTTTDNLLISSFMVLDYYSLVTSMLLIHLLGGLKHVIFSKLVFLRNIYLRGIEERRKEACEQLTNRNDRQRAGENNGESKGGKRPYRRKISFIKLKYIIKASFPKYAIYVSAFSCIFTAAYFGYKTFEVITFFVAYLSLRGVYPIEYHQSKWVCLVKSCVIFGFTTFVLPPLHLTLSGAIIASTALTYILWKFADHDRLRSDETKEKELRKACAKANLSSLLTETAVGCIIYNKTVQQQADEEAGATYEAIKKRRTRIFEKLSPFWEL